MIASNRSDMFRCPYHRSSADQVAHVSVGVFTSRTWSSLGGRFQTFHVYSTNEDPRQGYSSFSRRSNVSQSKVVAHLKHKLQLAATNCLGSMRIGNLTGISEAARRRAIDKLPPFWLIEREGATNLTLRIFTSLRRDGHIQPDLGRRLRSLDPLTPRDLTEYEAFLKV